MAMSKQPEKKTPLTDQPAASSSYHIPVLLHEAVDGLLMEENGIYVDCTFGGGGHSREILGRLGKEGRLVVFDQDADVRAQLPADRRVIFEPHNFRHIKRFLRLHRIDQVDGILADLGVSSHQFDEAGRGFSIRYDAPLDMRMDRRQELTAFEVIQTYTEQRLHKIFEMYGEVTNARTLANTIVGLRSAVSLRTVNGFKQAIGKVIKGNPNRYLAQVFQSLRIEVNDELGALREMLGDAVGLLKPRGRIVVITFHSLEDRLVKNFFKKGSFGDEKLQDPFGSDESKNPLRVVNKKIITPGTTELVQNKRSRSAVLRIAEKREI